MNILFVLSSFAHPAGVERVMSDKMNYLAEQGHQVVFATYEQGQHPLVFPLHEAVKHVDLGCPYFTLYRYPLFLRLLKARSMKRLFLQRLQKLVNENSIELMVAPTNAVMFMGEMMKTRGVCKVIESHGAFTKTMRANTFFANVGKKIQLKAIRKCDLLITLTREDADCWNVLIPQVINLPNPVTSYNDVLPNFDKTDNRIIAVGRLNSQKRFDRLIEAFSLVALKYPLWFIDIYGDGEDRLLLLDRINKMNLQGRVNLKGQTDFIFSEYMKSQFLVLSSDYEGMPLVLLEAMASGIPCVSTRCPCGPSDVIDDGVTGLLCNMDVEDLAAKMEWMMSHEIERKEMGVKAHQVTARYKKERVMKEWEQAYMSVLA